MNLKSLLLHIRGYLNLRPHKENERAIIDRVNAGITFRGGNLWVLIFAILIASLGLNVNSTAVIIGAMLISPLMGPIIGMGFAMGTMDIDMLRRAAKNFAVATVISILTATVYWLITPLSEVQSELLARTSPTLYDVLIAFCGGAAGIIALCTKDKGNVIPGVAIATALMPPLCTAGFGLGTGNLRFFFGAAYLFFINTVFIATATYAGVRLMHFHRKAQITPERAIRVRRRITTVIIIFLIPALLMTISIVQQSIFDHNVSKFVKTELAQSGTQIISSEVVDHEMRIVAVGREISTERQQQARVRLDRYGLDGYELSVIQGIQYDSTLSGMQATHAAPLEQQLFDLTTQNSHYQQQLETYSNLERLNSKLPDEVRPLFPQVASVCLSLVKQPETDDHYIVAIVETADDRNLSADDSRRLRLWLKARTDSDSVALFQTQ